MFRTLRPEVATEMEDGTVLDTSVHPPIVERLSVRFEGWFGDDLLEMFPSFLVTERLKIVIEETELSGCLFDDVTVSRSLEFDDLYPDLELPKFYWMKVFGRGGEDDFGLSDNHCLVASEKAFELLKSFKIDNCDVEEFRR